MGALRIPVVPRMRRKTGQPQVPLTRAVRRGGVRICSTREARRSQLESHSKKLPCQNFFAAPTSFLDAILESNGFRVPPVYLGWANPALLAFFAINGINNLRLFSVVLSSIPTAPTNILVQPLDLHRYFGRICRNW